MFDTDSPNPPERNPGSVPPAVPGVSVTGSKPASADNAFSRASTAGSVLDRNWLPLPLSTVPASPDSV
jgi:hypothetical protein